MACIDNIIAVNDKCGDVSESGLYLFDAPEISLKNLAKIANEDYVSGVELAKQKISQAAILIRNDFMTVLASSGFIPSLDNRGYSSGDFNTTKIYPAEAKERGLIIKKNRRFRGKTRVTKIRNVYVYPTVSAEGVQLKVYEDYNGGIVSIYDVDLTANEINTIPIDHIIKGNWAKVLIDGTSIPMVSSELTCTTGCFGAMPNECGNTAGWYGDKEVSNKEGFGINVDFVCECGYEAFLCAMSKTFIGEIVWLKSRVMLMEEHLRTNRLNNWTVYNGDELKAYMIDVENQYREKWNTFITALPNILKSQNDDCFECRNFRWATNV